MRSASLPRPCGPQTQLPQRPRAPTRKRTSGEHAGGQSPHATVLALTGARKGRRPHARPPPARHHRHASAGAPLGLCSSIQAFANLTIPNIASSRITTTPEEPSTLLSCYRDCGADPACMAPLFTTPPTSANAFVANGTCTLISEVDAPNIAAANFSYPAFFLRCDNATGERAA